LRGEREAVRRVAEQVAVDEHLGDVARDVVAHARAHEQRVREAPERPRVVADLRRLRLRAHRLSDDA
jgi:NTP pyrophosphatase (non-canonical NTP hydrolase)